MNLPDDRYSVMTLLSVKNKKNIFFSILKTAEDLLFLSFQMGECLQ